MKSHLIAPSLLLIASWGQLAAPMPASAAELRLASPFSDHMVLQRDKSFVVWGVADAGATVEVTIGENHGTAAADASGLWKATLNAMRPTNAPRELRVASGGKEAAVRDVLVGDVWLCAGQSNMQMGLRETDGGPAEVRAAADHTRLRLLTIPKKASAEPEPRFDAVWRECSPAAAGSFSAVAYYFARDLLADPAMANVPVGLIDCSFGGTAVEAWTSADGLAPFDKKDLLPSMFGIAPGALYNAMVAPLAPLRMAGALWYQGESNAARPDLYPRLLAAMIADWRGRFDNSGLPFLVVQLPAFTDPKFTWVREAQAAVVRATPHTALAVTTDTTEGYDLHPKQKREVGRRLALLARRLVLKEDLVAVGPTIKEAKVDGATVRVTFDTQGDGLTTRPGSDPVRGFALAGEDGAYRFADAAIDGDAVVLRCDAVPAPKTVRYAWAGIPDANLTNRSGLPAAPFRTDDLPRSNFEVQQQATARRVAAEAYEVEVNGDGKVTSLGVRGKQFLSNAVGADGGTSIPFLFGPRQLADVRAVGPDLLTCGDSEATLSLAFRAGGTDWSIANRSKNDFQFRVALAARVQVGDLRPGEPLTLRRGKAGVSVAGVDAVMDGEDGRVLQVNVKAGATKRLTLTVDPPR